MTSYCGSHGESPVCRTHLIRRTQSALLVGLSLFIIALFLLPAASAQTSGRGSFNVSGSEQYYCPGQSPTQSPTKNQLGPLSICSGRIADGGTVTIIVNGWSTNVSYTLGSTTLTVAQALTNALNVSASPVTATVSSATVTMTAKATGTQSNYAVTSSSSTSLPQYFASASFFVNPATFSLTGGTDIPPAAPSGISATPAANGLSIAVSWIDNANNENNYSIERCTGSGCSSFSVLTSTLPANTTGYTDWTTAAATTYRYRVQAMNTAGGSGYATTSDVTTPSVPAAPTNFNAAASADGRSVTVTWTDNATNETGYSGNYCPGGTPAGCTTWQNVGTYAANTTSYALSGLSPGSTNKFEVHAYNAVGDSTHVGNVDVTQPNYPGVPSITSAISGSNGTTATITWSSVSGTTAYYLERCTGSGCNSSFTVVGNNLPANQTSFGDSGLTMGTTYGYRVRAYNAVGYSGYSAIAYMTPMMAPPAAPTGLTATGAHNGQSVSLSWTDNASNESSYELQRCTGTSCGPTNFQALAANTASYTDSPTATSTLFGYAVCAVNAGGSSCSSTVYVTTNSGIATVHYYISDHLGSSSLVVNSNGAVEEEEMFYPYGGERWTSGNDPNHYKFTGKERDSETGLDYSGARYYGSSLARFITPDAKLMSVRHLMDPQKWNRYAYVHNNPLAFIDPDGLDDWFVFRPLVGSNSANSPKWQAAIKAAEARGDHVHMLKGKDATVQAFNKALKTKDAHVLAITHAGPDPKGNAGGIELSNGISSGSWGSEYKSTTKNTLTVTSTDSFEIAAREVAIIGCNSQVLAEQYSDTTFIGNDPGPSGGISTVLGSAEGADILEAGGGQAGVDAANAEVLNSQDPRDTGSDVQLNPPVPPPPPPEDPPE